MIAGTATAMIHGIRIAMTLIISMTHGCTVRASLYHSGLASVTITVLHGVTTHGAIMGTALMVTTGDLYRTTGILPTGTGMGMATDMVTEVQLYAAGITVQGLIPEMAIHIILTGTGTPAPVQE